MSYMKQGAKEWDVGVKAPIGGRGGASIIREAEGKTVGIVGQAGIAKGGLPIKGGK